MDLRVDADRDGLVTAADEAGEETATIDQGAILLANVDDDGHRCAADLDRRMKARVRLVDLTVCRDADDEVVDGAEDARDLAPVEVAPIAAPVTVTAAGEAVRVFVAQGDGWAPVTGPLDASGGLKLGVEALDVVRSGDGVVRLTATAPGAAPDVVALRVSPLLALDATRTAGTVLADAPRSTAEIDRDYRAALARERRLGRSPREARARAARERAFARAQRAFLRGLDASTGLDVRQQRWGNAWVQDLFEDAYQSMPLPGGRAQTMRVALLAGSPVERDALSPRNPMATATAAALRNLRGPDAAVVQHLPEGPVTPSRWTTTGTMEATPPVPGAPRGRLIVGARTSMLPPSTAQLVAAQGGAQPLLQLSTGWLDIGHTDEFLAFVPAATPRGWVALVADPRGALDLLAAGSPHAPVRAGLRDLDGRTAQRTAKAILDGPVGRASRAAAGHIDEQLAILTRELSLTPQDIVRVPVLYAWRGATRYVVAYSGNAVNGLAPGGRRFLAPDPHVGAFKKAIRDRLSAKGIATRFVDTWPIPHLGSGELHCMTNARRDLGDGRWFAGPDATPRSARRGDPR